MTSLCNFSISCTFFVKSKAPDVAEELIFSVWNGDIIAEIVNVSVDSVVPLQLLFALFLCLLYEILQEHVNVLLA